MLPNLSDEEVGDGLLPNAAAGIELKVVQMRLADDEACKVLFPSTFVVFLAIMFGIASKSE